MAEDEVGAVTTSRCGGVRELPSGTTIVTLRVTMPRAGTPMTRGSSQRSDWVDCVASEARQRRRVVGWRVGDLVEVHGSSRRRVHRGGPVPAMHLEVEVLTGRMLARGARDPGPADDGRG